MPSFVRLEFIGIPLKTIIFLGRILGVWMGRVCDLSSFFKTASQRQFVVVLLFGDPVNLIDREKKGSFFLCVFFWGIFLRILREGAPKTKVKNIFQKIGSKPPH